MTIFNFIKELFFESKSDIIGLSGFKEKTCEVKFRKQTNTKELTLTDILRRTY